MRRRREEPVSRKTILLVEDDQDQIVLAMRALRKHGIVAEVDEVVVAESGEEGIDYLFGEGSHETTGTPPSCLSSCSSTCICRRWTASRS